MDIKELIDRGFTLLELVQAPGSNIAVADLEDAGVPADDINTLKATLADLENSSGLSTGKTVVIMAVVLLLFVCGLLLKRSRSTNAIPHPGMRDMPPAQFNQNFEAKTIADAGYTPAFEIPVVQEGRHRRHGTIHGVINNTMDGISSSNRRTSITVSGGSNNTLYTVPMEMTEDDYVEPVTRNKDYTYAPPLPPPTPRQGAPGNSAVEDAERPIADAYVLDGGGSSSGAKVAVSGGNNTLDAVPTKITGQGSKGLGASDGGGVGIDGNAPSKGVQEYVAPFSQQMLYAPPVADGVDLTLNAGNNGNGNGNGNDIGQHDEEEYITVVSSADEIQIPPSASAGNAPVYAVPLEGSSRASHAAAGGPTLVLDAGEYIEDVYVCGRGADEGGSAPMYAKPVDDTAVDGSSNNSTA